ncbi:MAG: beta-lactamase family protein [Candidatus Obscuribacterales bacterium]|nr:beta-lactamase family protein [Steroidobacteraceae bacterium]
MLHTARILNAKLWLAVVLTAMLAACAGVGPSRGQWPTPADVAIEKTGFSTQGLAALDAKMKEAVDKNEVAGIVSLLVRHGQVAAFNAHGVQSYASGAPMTKDTLFRIYSMTKPVTGVALMQLYEKGLWKLDEPITKFVPELANLKVHKTDGKATLVNVNRPATMRELMTHTAGFGYGLAAGNSVDDAFRAEQPLAKASLKEMVDTVAKLPLLAQPGERWSYSIAVDIQGLIVERLSGEKFGDYLDNHIFKPLNMTETNFFLEADERARLADVYQWDRPSAKLAIFPDVEGRGYFDANHLESGGGGLVSTTHDYARFCQMLLNKGALDGKRILKPESVDLMTQNHIGSLRLYSDGTRANAGLAGTGFGLDFAVVYDPAAANSKQGEGSYYWSGIAGTWFWIDPKNDLFFIGMIQRRGAAGQGTVNFRADSTKLVYDALQPGT